MTRRILAVSMVAALSLGACTTPAPVTAPAVQQGDVIVFPGRQAVMMYADVKESVRGLLNLVEILCASPSKAGADVCKKVPDIRQQFHDLDIRTRTLLLAPTPTNQNGTPDYAAITEVLGKLIGIAAGVAL